MAFDNLKDEASETLVELFFDCEEPDERDALFDALVARNDETTQSFLRAVLAHDEDPFMQVAAAAALLSQDPLLAEPFLLEKLETSSDELLFEDALSALLARPHQRLFDVLAEICGDSGRDVAERRLAKIALEQLDEARARQLARELVQNSARAAQEPLDLLSMALATLVRSAEARDRAIVAEAAAAVPQALGPEADSDDVQALQDLFAEAQALMAASI